MKGKVFWTQFKWTFQFFHWYQLFQNTSGQTAEARNWTCNLVKAAEVCLSQYLLLFEGIHKLKRVNGEYYAENMAKTITAALMEIQAFPPHAIGSNGLWLWTVHISCVVWQNNWHLQPTNLITCISFWQVKSVETWSHIIPFKSH